MRKKRIEAFTEKGDEGSELSKEDNKNNNPNPLKNQSCLDWMEEKEP